MNARLSKVLMAVLAGAVLRSAGGVGATECTGVGIGP